MNDNTVSRMKLVADHARTSDAILFAGLAAMVAQAVAQELSKPAIAVWLQPTTPTREFPSVVLPRWPLPGWLNVVTHHAIERLSWLTAGKEINAARKKLFGTVAKGRTKLDFAAFYGISSHLVPRPRDWPATHHMCGHWPLPLRAWTPPHELLEFLSAGPPPIYVGFGSVADYIRKKRLTALVGAIAGRRALFFPGWSKIDASMLPSNFFILGDTPHDWLFPRTSMVMHHGGAGTTHTAARAGVPSVVLPLMTDQRFWADTLALAGVAPKYVSSAKHDAKAIAKMIQFAEREDVRERARALGAAMSQEDGVAYAVKEIEAYGRAGQIH